MTEAILDSNFILTAVKAKIDFLNEMKFMGLTPVLPIQVIDELKKITSSKKKAKFKEHAELALKILHQNKPKEIDIKNAYVDQGIIDYASQNKDVIIATMDKELRSKIKNRKLVVRGMKKLELV